MADVMLVQDSECHIELAAQAERYIRAIQEVLKELPGEYTFRVEQNRWPRCMFPEPPNWDQWLLNLGDHGSVMLRVVHAFSDQQLEDEVKLLWDLQA